MQTTVRFARLFKTMPFDTEKPTVIAAADAFILDFAVVERRAPVHTPRVKQPSTTLLVAEENEVLPKDSNLLRAIRDLSRYPDGVPIATEPFACRRASRDARENVVGLSLRVVVGAAGDLFDGDDFHGGP
jgi:hypothetical protein